jgi:luciferase family oxidoreductase group 1
LRYSVLDQSPVSEGTAPAQAIRNSIDLARRAEHLGYHRYWVAEHHGSPMLSGASPEVLISAIGANTSTMRVGSGGVMLPHYSPLKVAETFSILSALYPGRIDLGLGRAAGTDPRTTLALQRDRRQAAPDDFPQQLVELLAYLEGAMPIDHPFARIPPMPGSPERPEPWLLGSSPQSGIWAAELGLPYAFADFINPLGAEIARRYRAEFTPAQPDRSAPAAAAPEHIADPRVMVCSWVICAETDEEARRLASSTEMSMRLLLRGEFIPVPTVEKALAFLERDRAVPSFPGAARPRRRIIGSPETVRAALDALAAEYAADEVMIVTITHDHDARCRSYELVSEALGLTRG